VHLRERVYERTAEKMAEKTSYFSGSDYTSLYDRIKVEVSRNSSSFMHIASK